jgi:subtilisin
MSTPGQGPIGEPQVTTGRYIVYFAEQARTEAARILTRDAGLSVATQSAETSGPLLLEFGDALIFQELGVAVVMPDRNQVGRLKEIESEQASIVSVEPDRIVHAIPEIVSMMSADDMKLFFRDFQDVTWGLRKTMVEKSQFGGKGIRLAVLDTGMDLGHLDFEGRPIVSRSFIKNQTVQDRNGHGTHCIGTACGPRKPQVLPRYGVAYDCEIFVAKVLNDAGIGSDAEIAAGINWALANNCKIISMSLGAPVWYGDQYSKGIEDVARASLERGSVIVAAAGNDSQRNSGYTPRPVSHPANCPSVLAVGAVDIDMKVADFSNAGEVALAGPGVNIYSSAPNPTAYLTLSGTSMAVPHVAGIAALYAEARPGIAGRDLRDLLTSTALRLNHPRGDVGAGLVQAP